MSRLKPGVGGVVLLLLAACGPAAPEPVLNVTLEEPRAARPESPPPASAPVAVGRDAIALERAMVPELVGVATTPGRWTLAASAAIFRGADGTALGFACEAGGTVRIAHRPLRAPTGESSLQLLTERGANRFPGAVEGADIVAHFTARLPFFTDALSGGRDRRRRRRPAPPGRPQRSSRCGRAARLPLRTTGPRGSSHRP